MKAGTASPISDDIPMLVRTLAGTTALMLTGDPVLAGRDGDLRPPRAAFSSSCG